jgi:hypothetical protein
MAATLLPWLMFALCVALICPTGPPALDAPSIVIFDLDQYVHVMLVQTDVHRNAKAKRSSSNLILLGPV